VSKPFGYSLLGYGEMIQDERRMRAYAEALRRTVRPGSTVVDIGAGTGILSLLACQLGAARVHAIEPDPSVATARTIAHDSGYADRITFHEALSTQVSVTEPADVVVSDLRSVLPLFQHHIPSIQDARTRLLAPTGTLIPERDTLWASLVEAPETYRRYADPWTQNDYGFDMSAGFPQVVNTWRRVQCSRDQLLTTPARWATLDYRSVAGPDIDGVAEWEADRPGTAHGVISWFDAQLTADVGFSNAPGGPELIYGQAFFPLEEPQRLAPGDRVSIRFRADLVGGEYVWRWETLVTGASRDGSPRAHLRQSTFDGMTFTPQVLRKRRSDFVPTLSLDGQIDATALAAMGEGLTLQEIATRILERFPDRFETLQSALDRAAELSVTYSD
jgi:type I protein arginine methyltransferase